MTPLDPTPPLLGPYKSVKRACRHFGISRSTFYRMKRSWPAFAELLVRVPPRTGPVRVPIRAVERLLAESERSS